MRPPGTDAVVPAASLRRLGACAASSQRSGDGQVVGNVDETGRFTTASAWAARLGTPNGGFDSSLIAHLRRKAFTVLVTSTSEIKASHAKNSAMRMALPAPMVYVQFNGMAPVVAVVVPTVQPSNDTRRTPDWALF